MYEELVKRIRGCSYSDPNGCKECHDCPNAENYYECKQKLALQAADAIEELANKLCDWCGVCPKERRRPWDCKIMWPNAPIPEVYIEPPKEET